MELIFFISRAKQIYTKTFTIFQKTLKIKTMSRRTLFKVLLTSAVIYKQRIWLENEIVQYLQNYRCKDVNQGNFRKSLDSSTNTMKNDYPNSARTDFTDRSICCYIIRLNRYNYCIAFTKSIKLHFLEIALQYPKIGEVSHPYSNPVKSNSPLKILKITFLLIFS